MKGREIDCYNATLC